MINTSIQRQRQAMTKETTRMPMTGFFFRSFFYCKSTNNCLQVHNTTTTPHYMNNMMAAAGHDEEIDEDMTMTGIFIFVHLLLKIY